MLVLALRRSGELLRFEFGAPVVPDRTADSLVHWYLDDPDERFEELWELRPGDVRTAVSAMTKDLEEPGHLVAATRVLGCYALKADHDSVEPLLDHEDGAVRQAAIRAIGRMGNGPRHGCLLPFLSDPDAPTRRVAVLALGKFGIEQVEPHLDAAQGRDPELAAAVATAKARISAIGQRDFVGLLESVLAGEEWDDLLCLMLFLKKFLREMILDTARSEEQRAHAIRALGLWRIRRASWPLKKLLADPDTSPRLRLEAVMAIGRARLRSAIADLLALFEDPQSSLEMRRQAAMALGRIGDTSAFGPLVELFEPSAPELRAAVRLGLRKMAQPVDDAMLESIRQDPAMMSESVVHIDDDLELRAGYSTSAFRVHLEGPDAAARRDATIVVGCLGNRDDAAALGAIAMTDPDPVLRELATWAAGKIG